MINFTGQTKKRVVNLGNNRRSSNGASSRNYLEHTKLQRQQREEQRQKEKSGIVLQAHIRRYLSLRNESQYLQDEWINEYKNANQDDTFQWSSWITKFMFISKWSFPFQTVNKTHDLIIVLKDALTNDKYNDKISRQLCKKLMGSLILSIDILSKIDKEAKIEISQTIMLIIIAIKKLIQIQSLIVSDTCQGLISSLSTFYRRFRETISDADRCEVVDLVFEININDSHKSFTNFFSIENLMESLPQNNHENKKLDTIRNIFSEPTNDLYSLSEQEKVNFLINLLDIHGEEREFNADDYIIIGLILSSITFSLLDEDLINDEMEVDDEPIAADVNESRNSRDVVYINSRKIKKIQILYSSNYIKQGLENFTSADKSNKLSILALNSFATLIYLIPEMKGKLCMLITITPGSYSWFYNQLQQDPIYKFIEEILGTQDYARSYDLTKLYEKLDLDREVSRFWKTLFTFEELYSYWLIVSNDLESLNEDKLSIDDVINFLKFLKTLCLTLIFNNTKTKRQLFMDYYKLKNISIALLNQLYLKNSRMNFAPENIWKTIELSFNINSMLQLVANEEERRIEMEHEENSDDEMISNGQFSTLKSSTLKKPKFNIPETETSVKLEILKKLPFFILFKDRVKIFQSLIDLDKARMNIGDYGSPKLRSDIRREFLLEDAFMGFHNVGEKLKNPLQIKFFNEYGGEEAGIDGGGITKEFLTSVAIEGFNPNNELKLFKETNSDNQLYPNDEIFKCIAKKINTDEQMKKLLYLKFLGSIIGKCFYDNVLIDISFAPFFLNKWCNTNNSMRNSINDLNYLDSELFINLMKLIKMSPNEIENLDLNFTIDEKINNENIKFNLVGNNVNDLKNIINVNSNNKLNYIHQISNYKLNKSLHIQTKYFLDGLFEIIDANWLSMFDANELQMLISGGENDVNIQDWKENVEYGGFFDDDLTIIYFWEVVNEMTSQERFKLIKFVTSVSRAPLLGFNSLKPKFGIRNSGRSNERLPTASTCVNLLKLPDYKDKEIIRSKLIYAINTESRFDLS